MIKRFVKFLIIVICMAAGFLPYAEYKGVLIAPAYAQCGGECSDKEHERLHDLMEEQNAALKETISNEFRQYQLWFMNEFFDNYVAPSIVLMAEQLTTLASWQMFTLGTFFDADQQLKTQRVFQDLAAQAHKEYRTSEELCRMGTLSRGMVATIHKGRMTANYMNEASQKRQLSYKDHPSAAGGNMDRSARVEQFKGTYCDAAHNGGGFETICNGGGPADRVNKDMNFTRTLGNPMTLDVDFTDTNLTDDEEDLLALNRNLFAHDLFLNITRAALDAPENLTDYIDARAIVAKRSILENSFFALAALKSAGGETTDLNGEGTGRYIAGMLQELGMTYEEAQELVGEQPSYYALLDIMNQKAYMNPRFFTELYDSPANVKRKIVAMQAADLMMGREAYKSELRYEGLLSLWLELELVDFQRSVSGRMSWIEELKD